MGAMRWFPAVLVLAGLAVILFTALLPDGSPPSGNPGDTNPPPTSAGSSLSEATPSAEPTLVPSVASVDYVGPEYDTNVIRDPTASSSQSKLWFNDGSWWGLLASDETNQFHIHELHWESQRWVDTGVVVEDRPFAGLEVMWDGSSLYVAGSGSRNSPAHAVRVTRYTYDPDGRRYRLEVDFPRTLTAGGVGAISLAKGSDGRVWMAYVADRNVHVSYSETDGITWSPAVQLSGDGADVDAERAAIVATSSGIAVAWTSLHTNELYVARHADGDLDEWTIHAETVDGLVYGDDELSVRAAADDSILVVVRTSLDRVENRNPSSPQLVLARLAGDDWTQSMVARVEEGHTGPQLVVDDARGHVYVIASADGDIVVKVADLDDLSFSPGFGTLVIPAPVAPTASPLPSSSGMASADPSADPSAEPRVPAMANVSTTGQRLDGLSEIVVLASDDETGRYGHAVISFPDGRQAPIADGHLGPLPEGVTTGLTPGETSFHFRDSFSSIETDSGTINGWETRDEPADEVMTIAVPSEGDPALRLIPDDLGGGARACKPFPPSTSGVVIVVATVQARGTPDSDATITALRSAGSEVASVRFGEPGTLRYFLGDVRAETNVPYQPGEWYRSVLTLDLASQTYDWEINPLGTNQRILTITDAPLRVAAVSVDQVCVQSAGQLAGGNVELYVDDVSVEVGPGG